MKNALKLLSLGAVTFLAALYWLGGTVSEPYSIQHPAKGKNHAIVQLISTNGTKAGAGCSAFVVSDKLAVTAAHCIEYDKHHTSSKKHLDLLKRISELEKQGVEELKKLSACFTSACAQEAQAIISLLGKMEEKKKILEAEVTSAYIIRNSYGEDTGIRAIARYKSPDTRDYGLLEGNFKDFEKLPVKRTFDLKQGDQLRGCGYAKGTKPPTCTSLVYYNNRIFMHRVIGYFVKGMSGGAVIDAEGYAVGIISAVGDGYVEIDSLLGVFAYPYERPKVKTLIKRVKIK